MGQGAGKDKSKRPKSPGGGKQGAKDNNEPTSANTAHTVDTVIPQDPLANDGDWVSEIRDEETWLKYKHEPTDRSFSHVQVVKVVVPVSARVQHPDSDIYFIQSDKWVFHWHFTRDIVRDPGSQDLGAFNTLNYLQDDRDFVCITVTRYLDQDLYSFELAARDNFPAENIAKLYDLLCSKLYFGSKLFYRPLSKLHEKIVATHSREALPIIESSKLFSGVKYQPLTIGTTYGFLRRVPEGEGEDEAIDAARWNDILLCEGIPNDLPVISGLITSSLQTPLCHVALLCGNRGTPNIASVGCYDDAALTSLEGKPVKLVVRMSDYVLEECKEQEVNEYQAKAFAKLRKGTNIELKSDVGEEEVFKFERLLKMSPEEFEIAKNCIGAKALNCLELVKKKVGSNVLESSFVIPYYYYHDAMKRIFVNQRSLHWDGTYAKRSKADLPAADIYNSLIADAKANATPDPKNYAQECAKIRKLVEQYVWEDPKSPWLEEDEEPPCESPPGMWDFVRDIIEEWRGSGLWKRCDGIILRSSTNAEDIEGFNAAGLYESIVVKREIIDKNVVEAKIAILQALAKVWASVWNFRGFEERRLFGLDSAQVKMAVLCQPLFSSADTQICNGVAVSAHPTRHDFPGALINVQVAGRLVTDSCGGARPEQHVVWMYGRQQAVVETICRSSIAEKEELMSETDVQKLATMLLYLDEQFGHRTPGTKSNIIQGGKKTKFCVDVEFIVLKESKEIVVLQCRPYKMVYEYDHARNKPQQRPA